jgi:hypothetical protein
LSYYLMIFGLFMCTFSCKKMNFACATCGYDNSGDKKIVIAFPRTSKLERYILSAHVETTYFIFSKCLAN